MIMKEQVVAKSRKGKIIRRADDFDNARYYFKGKRDKSERELTLPFLVSNYL